MIMVIKQLLDFIISVMDINNGIVLQWVIAKGTSPNNVTVNFPIAFNQFLTGAPILFAPYVAIYGWDIVTLTTARGVYFRQDYNASYTLYGIFIGN